MAGRWYVGCIVVVGVVVAAHGIVVVAALGVVCGSGLVFADIVLLMCMCDWSCLVALRY